ncbi:MAG: hypothetical protein A3G83_06660 [Betaproteobacteria bacterium RIFCSPLOWO2_12_FULL_68_20]|nr:MAG: hypothetical protein A3G83_06660 [Betaproteobacteria bacterium RIFCSPLOWO2_12_FULL_68_20]
MTGTFQIHTQSLRLASGSEALVTRVLAGDGRIGYGFSLDLDATAARHMAEWHAGVRDERPEHEPALDHPWEQAWAAGKEIDWNIEPGFASLRWLP